MADFGDYEKERFLQKTKPSEVEGVPINWSELPSKTIRDIRGMRFGKLIVKAYAYTDHKLSGKKVVYWKCQCDCGNECEIARSKLVYCGTKSCGCLSVVGHKGVVNGKKTKDKRNMMMERMRLGLPPVPPTEVIGDPANIFAYESLMAYACLQWAGYEPAAHHHLIAKYLEKVEKGEIKRLMIFMPPRSGKLLADSTVVFTSKGWKKHGDLKIGDYVFGSDGGITKIIATSEKQLATLEVTLSNGESFKCHEAHEWAVINDLENNKKYIILETIKIKDDLSKGVKYRFPCFKANFDYVEILSVEYCDPEPGNCIQVEAKDGIYYVGRNLIPTHNSMIVSEYFPAWYLGRNPDKRVIATSYGQELASDFGRKVRNQIADPMYSEIFLNVALSGDSAASDKFDMAPPNKGGYFAVGAGGAITGRGAHCFVGDTFIFTEYGKIPISEIFSEFYDTIFHVLSYNESDKCLEFKKVSAVKLSYTDSLIEITLWNDVKIKSTPNHPFCCFIDVDSSPIPKRLMRYILAKDLTTSSILVGIDLSCSLIKEIKEIQCKNKFVYDIEVTDNHNFFAEEVLVHNCLIIDDPVKSREDSDSESSRRKIKDWYTAVAYTRLMGDGAIVICQTRWHTEDLSGWLLKEHKHEKWTVLNLPAINDQGEALWPEKFPIPILEQIKKTLPARDWEALYQQKPFVEEGGIFKRQWWQMWPDTKPLPECEFIIQSWDTAFSDKEAKSSDYSARVTLGVFKRTDDEYHNVMLLEAWKDRVEYAELRKEALRAYQDYEPDKVIIEKKASGLVLVQDLRRSGLPIATYTPTKDKVTRAYAAQSLFENGRVYYPSRKWAEDVLTDLAQFPQGAHDDLVDAITQAIIWLQSSFLVAHSDDAKRRQREDDEEDEDLPSNVSRLRPKKKRASYG